MKKRGPTAPFDIVTTVGLALPEVEATTNWDGWPALKVRGCFMAGLASRGAVEPGTLVVRCALDDRERFLEDAPDTYYVTDYYRPYPVVLVRLSQLDRRALHELLAVSWRMALEKAMRRSGPGLRREATKPARAPASSTALAARPGGDYGRRRT
jgi:hypothetical protein